MLSPKSLLKPPVTPEKSLDLSLVAFFERESLKGSEKSVNIATTALSWQHQAAGAAFL